MYITKINGQPIYQIPGAIGATGPIGSTGADSTVQGPQGNQGLQGPQGNQGNQGLQGPQGFQGPTGSIGINGAQGPVGSTGINGAQGPTGTNGIQGPQGVNGGSIYKYIYVDSINGNNANAGTLSAPVQTMEYAVSIATAGTTIYVQAGTYAPVSNLYKNGVNWYFDYNVNVNTTNLSGVTHIFYCTTVSLPIIIDGHLSINCSGSKGFLYNNETSVNVIVTYYTSINSGSANTFDLAGNNITIKSISETNSGSGISFNANGTISIFILETFLNHTGTGNSVNITSAGASNTFLFRGNANRTTNVTSFILGNVHSDITAGGLFSPTNSTLLTSTYTVIMNVNHFDGNITLGGYGNILNIGYSDHGTSTISVTHDAIINCGVQIGYINAASTGVVTLNCNSLQTQPIHTSNVGKIVINGDLQGFELDTYGTVIVNGNTDSSVVVYNGTLTMNGSVAKRVALLLNTKLITTPLTSILGSTFTYSIQCLNNCTIVSNGGRLLNATVSINTNGYIISYYGYSTLWVKADIAGGTITDILTNNPQPIRIDTAII